MAGNPMLNAFQGISSTSIITGESNLESNAVCTVPPFCFKSLPGHSNRSLSHLPLPIHAEDIIPTYVNWNTYIGLCWPKALTLTRLRSDELFINIKSVVLRVILSFPLLRHGFLHRLARGIPLKEGVPWIVQSMVRTPRPHLRSSILGC